jgi:hypothetical protein
MLGKGSTPRMPYYLLKIKPKLKELLARKYCKK